MVALPGKAILIVDDTEDDRFLLSRLVLRAYNAGPIVVKESAEGAVAYLTDCCRHPETAPCAVLTDLKMPGIGGMGLLEWIKSQPQLQAVRVAIVSNSDLAEEIKMAQSLGASAFFTKYPTAPELKGFLDS